MVRLSFIVLTLCSLVSFADNMGARVERRIRIATDLFEDRMLSRYPIPSQILSGAQCIASMRVAKAGFIWGGEGSTGLVSCRTAQGWSMPSFLNAGGPNFGIQFGVQFLDSVLVFMSAQGRKMLEGVSFKLGTDLSFAAGPVGEGVGIGATPKAQVLAYDRAVGLYAGATLSGYVFGPGSERNEYVYGKGVQPYQILRSGGYQAPSVIRPYSDMLEKFAR